MQYFLIVYNRAAGQIVQGPRAFPEAEADRANRERFALEVKERQNPEIEVVLLGAESLDDLMRTHSRYFRSVGEIVSRA